MKSGIAVARARYKEGKKKVERGTFEQFKPNEPIPFVEPDGNLFDANNKPIGEIPTKPEGWMARIDQKGSETVTLTKNTLWLMGAGVIIANLLFSYGGSIIGWTRDDQTVRSDVQVVKENVKELKDQVTAMQKTIQEDQIQRAKIEGFKAGVAETQSDKGAK